MRDIESEVKARGGRVAAIGLGDLPQARMFVQQTGIAFPLLVDLERTAYRAAELRSATVLGTLRVSNFVAHRRAALAGHKQRGVGKHPFQLGGTFIFGPGNVDLFASRSATFGDNVMAAEILAAITNERWNVGR